MAKVGGVPEVEAPKVARPAFGVRRSLVAGEEVAVGAPVVRQAAAPAAGVRVPTLAAKVPWWWAIGAGKNGKSFFGRYLGDRLDAEGHAWTLAALDAGGRTLARFFDGAVQPMQQSGGALVQSRDPTVVSQFLADFVEAEMQEPFPAYLDTGANDAAVPALLHENPDLVADLAGAGVAVVAAHFLSPRIEDLDPLATLEGMGFAPPNTLLIENHGTVGAGVDPEHAFGPVRAHSAFRAAVARGAVHIIMPRLSPEVSQKIELRTLHFSQARDGVVPAGRSVEPIGGLERSRVRRFLADMDTAFSPVREWMGLRG